jgi:hypothetical protein
MEEWLLSGLTRVKAVELPRGGLKTDLGSGGQAGSAGLLLAAAELLGDMGWGAAPRSAGCGRTGMDLL